jgi:predicted protein tyrosine phosphatase
MIHVCSLARLHEIVADTGARHVVSLIGDEANLVRPQSVAAENHLWLRLHDISAPLDGHIMPGEEHVADLIRFVRGWDRRSPLVVHCFMGISRSTASAYASVCALNPNRDEISIAQALHRRQRPISVLCRWPTGCSAATAAWSPPSRPSAGAVLPKKPRRSGSTWSRMRNAAV